MGKITYGIKLAKSTPFSIEINSRKNKLKQYIQEKNQKLVGRVLLDLADLYLNQAEYVENEDPTPTEEHYRQQDLEECLTYCKKAIKVFKSKKSYRYLAKTYIVMIQCYHRIPDFENGILINVKLLDLFKATSADCLKDKGLHQQAYKLLADAYFNHAHADRGIRKFSDFKHAEKFYDKERKMILKMTAEDVGGDKLILKDILRSSNFNLGVIKSKLCYDTEDISETKKILMDSIQDARLIKDWNGERKTWWELGNLYSARGDWELALDCRLKELQLIKKYRLNDYINVMIDTAKIYIMLENYSSCMDICREMRSWVKKMKRHKTNEDDDDDDDKDSNSDTEKGKKKKDQIDNDDNDDDLEQDEDGYDFEAVNDLIQTTIDVSYKISDKRKKLNQLINTSDSIESIIKSDNNSGGNHNDNSQLVNNIEHKKICFQIMEESLSLAEIYNEMELGKPILDIIDVGLKYCSSAFNNNNPPNEEEEETDYSLRVLEIDLLETKANIYIQFFFTSLTVIEGLNQHIIENAKKYIKDEVKQMDILTDAFERYTQMYYYFNIASLYDKWMKISEDAKEQYNQMISYEDKMDLDKTDGDKMDIDGENKDSFDEDKINEIQKSPNTTIRSSVLVLLNLKEKKTYILVYIDDLQKSMEWLASEVSRLTWEKYCIDPNINYFCLDGEQLPIDMTIDSLLMKPIKNLKANIIGYLERSLSDIYGNICERLKSRKNLKIIKALKEQTLPCVIDLRGTGLAADDIDPLIQFLKTITTPFDQIDLSANLLVDDDIIKLFDAIPCPPKVILNNNLLTLKSFDYFSEYEDILKSFDFSYNMVWSISQKQISHFYSKHNNLNHFLIDGYTIIDN